LANPQSLNLYGYVNNNPLSHADKGQTVEGNSADIVARLLALVPVSIRPESSKIVHQGRPSIQSLNDADSVAREGMQRNL
jgi:hypothetical protein